MKLVLRVGLAAAAAIVAAVALVTYAAALSITTAAITFPVVTLDGTDQTVTGSTSAWSANATGETGGWKVTVASTDFGTPTNEKQTITITGAPTGGTFTLTYGGQTTAAIAYNAAASAVESALELLTNIEAVTATLGPLPATAILVEFVDPGNQVVALMTATSSLTGGTSPAIAITETVAGAPGIDISATDQQFKIKIDNTNIVYVSGVNGVNMPVSTQTTFASLSGTPLKIVSAAAGKGNGVYNMTPDFQLTVPAETYTGSYTATVTVAISVGP